MKHSCAILLSSVLTAATALSTVGVNANDIHYGGMLSPALLNLSEDVCMIRSGLVSGEITFTGEAFERSVGVMPSYITVTAVPPSAHGTLYLGDAPVLVNQLISRDSLGSLRFVPTAGFTSAGDDNAKETSFRFKAGGEYSICCLLRYTDSANMSPVVSVAASAGSGDGMSARLWTQRDITTYGTLSALDPDGDSLTFEITRYPENGILRLTDTQNGDYSYTPCDGVIGEDSFSYVVRDEWGNYSAEVSVGVDIDKTAADLVLADMDGHWAHNAALVMAAENTMDVETINGKLYFHPDEEITREDFLVTVMKALGAGELEPTATVFDDDSEISSTACGYVARAYELGIIRGVREEGGLYFKPQETITRAEAAVILNTIVGAAEPDTVPVFADDSGVPAWARGALYALSDIGIFSGTGSGNLSPNAPLSRAQTAQILLTIRTRGVTPPR